MSHLDEETRSYIQSLEAKLAQAQRDVADAYTRCFDKRIQFFRGKLFQVRKVIERVPSSPLHHHLASAIAEINFIVAHSLAPPVSPKSRSQPTTP